VDNIRAYDELLKWRMAQKQPEAKPKLPYALSITPQPL
jgi:hypothetical protein